MARVINALIVLFEFIGLSRSLKERKIQFVYYYTQISNLIATASAILLLIFGLKKPVEVLRLTSTAMLLMTFAVTAFILVPLGGGLKDLMFKGNGFIHHLLCPVLSVISYMFAENRVSFVWTIVPVVITLIYGITMVCLNAKGIADGPYPFFKVKKYGIKKTVAYMVGLTLMIGLFSGIVSYRTPYKTDIKYVYVHGLAGWGSYDLRDEFIPYWGLSGGSIIRYMNNKGYESYSASVAPTGSAWDRACELYAQLTGSVVDYGKEHSERCGHERFGEDYSKKPLIKEFEGSKIVLIGHSFGGATIRLFSDILKDGVQAEINATAQDDLSPFFKGGNGDNLIAIVTLAAPTNGTTAYDMHDDPDFDLSKVSIPEEYEKNSDAVSNNTKAEKDGRIEEDYAAFDMHIDNALKLNESIDTFEDIYYFSVPCSTSVIDEAGNVYPDPLITENIFMKGAIQMSVYTGKTLGGYTIDEAWQPNDGLVNEISAKAPFNAPSKEYVPGTDPVPGVWYVMPTFRGDHMSLQGGLTKRINVKPFYEELIETITDAVYD